MTTTVTVKPRAYPAQVTVGDKVPHLIHGHAEYHLKTGETITVVEVAPAEGLVPQMPPLKSAPVGEEQQQHEDE